MRRVLMNKPPPKRFCDGTASLGQGGGFVEAADGDDAERSQRYLEKKFGIPKNEFARGRTLLLIWINAGE
jgi:hypothetical protein